VILFESFSLRESEQWRRRLVTLFAISGILVFRSEHMLSRCPVSACFAYLVFEKALLVSGIFSIGQRVCVSDLYADIPVRLGNFRAVERPGNEVHDLSWLITLILLYFKVLLWVVTVLKVQASSPSFIWFNSWLHYDKLRIGGPGVHFGEALKATTIAEILCRSVIEDPGFRLTNS